MSTTTTVLSLSKLRGADDAAGMASWLAVVQVTGTYATASKPNFDLAAALTTKRSNFSSVNVTSVRLRNDYFDGTGTRYTAPNANIALSSTGSSTNNVVTFRIDSGATNGSTGTEIPDATALATGTFAFEVLAIITGATGVV